MIRTIKHIKVLKRIKMSQILLCAEKRTILLNTYLDTDTILCRHVSWLRDRIYLDICLYQIGNLINNIEQEDNFRRWNFKKWNSNLELLARKIPLSGYRYGLNQDTNIKFDIRVSISISLQRYLSSGYQDINTFHHPFL